MRTIVGALLLVSTLPVTAARGGHDRPAADPATARASAAARSAAAAESGAQETSSLVGLTPARLLDSRVGGSTIDGELAGVGLRSAGSVIELPVAGRGGVPADAVAVVLNVAVTESGGAGFVTVSPCGVDRPLASNLNHAAGQTTSNAVVVKVGVGGRVCLYTLAATHLVIDVTGFFVLPPNHAVYELSPSTVQLDPAQIRSAGPGATADHAVIVLAAGARPLVVGGHVAIPPTADFPDGMFAEVVGVDGDTYTVVRAAIGDVLRNVDVAFAGDIDLSEAGAATADRSFSRIVTAPGDWECDDGDGRRAPAEELWDSLGTPLTIDLQNLRLNHYFRSPDHLFDRPFWSLGLSGEAVATVSLTAKVELSCRLSASFQRHFRFRLPFSLAGIPASVSFSPAMTMSISGTAGLEVTQRHYFNVALVKDADRPFTVTWAHSVDPPHAPAFTAAVDASLFAGGDVSVMVGGGYASANAQAGVYGQLGPEISAEISTASAGCLQFSSQLRLNLGIRLELWVKRWNHEVATLTAFKAPWGSPFCLAGPDPTTTGPSTTTSPSTAPPTTSPPAPLEPVIVETFASGGRVVNAGIAADGAIAVFERAIAPPRATVRILDPVSGTELTSFAPPYDGPVAWAGDAFLGWRQTPGVGCELIRMSLDGVTTSRVIEPEVHSTSCGQDSNASNFPYQGRGGDVVVSFCHQPTVDSVTTCPVRSFDAATLADRWTIQGSRDIHIAPLTMTESGGALLRWEALGGGSAEVVRVDAAGNPASIPGTDGVPHCGLDVGFAVVQELDGSSLSVVAADGTRSRTYPSAGFGTSVISPDASTFFMDGRHDGVTNESTVELDAEGQRDCTTTGTWFVCVVTDVSGASDIQIWRWTDA